jgi:hypothetical protein
MNIGEQAEEFLRRQQQREEASIAFQLLLLEHGAQIAVPKGG